jgi:hypothetical protein
MQVRAETFFRIKTIEKVCKTAVKDLRIELITEATYHLYEDVALDLLNLASAVTRWCRNCPPRDCLIVSRA